MASLLPLALLPSSSESQPPRDQDSEVFCDSVEQLEPELVRPTPIPSLSPPHWALAAPTTTLPPVDLVTLLCRLGKSRGALWEEKLTPETAPSLLQREVSLYLTLCPMVPVPGAFPWLPSWAEVKVQRWALESAASVREGLPKARHWPGGTKSLPGLLSKGHQESLCPWLALSQGSWGRTPRPVPSSTPAWPWEASSLLGSPIWDSPRTTS